MHSFWGWSDSKWGVAPASMYLQHTSLSTMKVTSNTVEMMAWQTKTASAFRIKTLIAPKLSLSGVDWWTEWSKTLTLLSSLERFRDMDYLIPTLSKNFQWVIPRPSTSDRDTARSGSGHPRTVPTNLVSPGLKGNTWETGRRSPRRTFTPGRNGMRVVDMWSKVMDSLCQTGGQIRPAPNRPQHPKLQGQQRSPQACQDHFSRRSMLTRFHLEWAICGGSF